LNNKIKIIGVAIAMFRTKAIVIASILPCLTIDCFSQDKNERNQLKNEISVSIMGLNWAGPGEYTSDLYVSFANGLGYKRYVARHAFRTGIEYRDSYSVGYGDFEGQTRYLEGKFNLGYQYAFSDKAVKPYLLGDFLYVAAKLDNYFLGGYYWIYSESHSKIHGIGYAPGLGVSFKLINSLSLSWEGNVEFLWTNEKGSGIRSEPNNIQVRNTFPIDYDEHSWYPNPLKRIALNFGFQ
jgi:hypothetical protein